MKVGVAGWPVAHSRSPVIFDHWFARYGINARYETIPVPPDEADAFFADLPAEWTGVNVTVPHKETAARHAVCDERAAALGTANTLWRMDGAVHATSSDGPGFVASLDQDAPQWRESGGDTLVLGAGGAALSVVDALTRAGARVRVANRTKARAEALATRTGAEVVAWEDAAAALREVRLVVNTTSLGMEGKPALPLDLAALPPGSVVADIVYVPLVTPLLAEARARGHVAVDGLGMLLHQATVGFERWFGVRPQVDARLREKVVATL